MVKGNAAEEEFFRAQRETQTASRIQRAFRIELSAYRTYGTRIFCMWDGSPANHGMIAFSSMASRPARFLAFADTASPAYLAHFLRRNWGLKTPEVLITVVGSAQGFDLEPLLEAAFGEGLASAATRADAWIVTGGTDTGVMKLVGNVLKAKDLKSPVIGIGPCAPAAIEH